NRPSNWLAPRGLPPVLDRLRTKSPNYAITASTAAAQLSPVAAPRLLVVYIEDAGAFGRKFDLRPAETGVNVLLVEPFNAVVFDRTIKRDGLVLANPSQLAADLLTSPGRG